MPFNFTPTNGHLFVPGNLYLGRDYSGWDIGLPTDRHAITIAGARSGKGASLIIPNAKRWPHNLLLIDPKGENAEATWKDREAFGQTVAVLDPFRIADIPDHLRQACNLLAAIDPNGLTAREDIRGIADGIVMRYKSEDATWDNGAVSVIAGVIDFVLATHDPEEHDLTAVRRILTLPPDELAAAFKDMSETPTRTGLARAAASIGLSDSRKNRDFVSGAVDHTEWLDSPAMASILTGDGVRLSELKTGSLSLYLVLPPEYLAEHGRFLRLFVRVALDAMAKGRKGHKCLFLLDEFFSLGHIDQIEKAAGLMPGYGVHLWPFLQDLGQLGKLYGEEGATTFFSNSDAHIFFGNTDQLTLGYVSQMLGILTAAEVGAAPVHARSAPSSGQGVAMFLGGSSNNHTTRATAHMTGAMYASMSNLFNSIGDSIAQAEYNAWQQKASMVGRPRVSPEEVRDLVGKRTGQPVAASMIVFAKAGDVFNLQLAPYFLPPPVPQIPIKERAGDLAMNILFGKSVVDALTGQKSPAKQYRRDFTTRDVLRAVFVATMYFFPWWFANQILLGIKNSHWLQQGVWVGQPALIWFVICVSLNFAFYRLIHRKRFKGTFRKFRRVEVKPEPEKENPA